MILKVRDLNHAISGWVSVGDVLPAIMLQHSNSTGLKYGIWSRSQSSFALLSASLFEIVQGDLPEDWTICSHGESVRIAPIFMQSDEFWDAYNRDEELATNQLKSWIMRRQGIARANTTPASN